MKIVRGASACLVDSGGRVMMIAREKEPFRDRFAFPGGAVEDHETPLEAARRELFEETGHEVAGLDAVASAHVEIDHGETRYAIDCFAFTSWKSGVGSLVPQWLTIDEALARDLAPGVADALAQLRERLARHLTVRSPDQ